MFYDLIDYFDVWGNAKDGWEVNNLCKIGSGIFIDDSCTDKEIVTYLHKGIKWLATDDMRKIVVEDLGDGFIEFYQRKGMIPLGRLQKSA